MRTNATAFGDCFLALLDHDDETGDGLDRRAVAIRLGEFVNLVCSALTTKKKK